jgi:hypothetical protein
MVNSIAGAAARQNYANAAYTAKNVDKKLRQTQEDL